MIDRSGYHLALLMNMVLVDLAVETFTETVPNYEKIPIVIKTLKNVDIDRHVLRLSGKESQQEGCIDAGDLTDDDLMLTTPILYGFSLSDKTWRTCSDLVDPFPNR